MKNIMLEIYNLTNKHQIDKTRSQLKWSNAE